MESINHSTEVELIQWSRDIWHQYELGNKSTARAMFRGIPEHRKAFVTLYMTMECSSSGEVTAMNNLITFIRSVTE